MAKTIKCSILTPEASIFEGEVEFAVVQAHNGEMGFLFNHTPLISELGIGEIRLSNSNSVEYLVVEGGIVEIIDNNMTILAESAIRKADLDKFELEEKMKELDSAEIAPFSKEGMLLTLEKQKVKARLKVASR